MTEEERNGEIQELLREVLREENGVRQVMRGVAVIVVASVLAAGAVVWRTQATLGVRLNSVEEATRANTQVIQDVRVEVVGLRNAILLTRPNREEDDF